MMGATAGFGAAVHTATGIDSTQITDQQILSAVQAAWPTIAALFYDSTGKLLP
jgi:hypothetical protein